MKKIIIYLLVFFILSILVLNPVLAGGDKVRGDEGNGEVMQEGPCPFGAETPAGPLN